jgi:hypothetical protein
MTKRMRFAFLGLVLTVAMAVSPHALLAKMECWPGGQHPWIDGYIYCMVQGEDCTYCEITMLPG